MDVTVAAGMVGTGLVTLKASEVCTVRFADNIGAVEIITDGTADVWYTLDGSTPTVGGPQCWRLPGGAMAVDQRDIPLVQTPVLLVSNSQPTVTVQRGSYRSLPRRA